MPVGPASEETVVGREEGIIGQGVKNIGSAESPEYVPNDVIVAANQLYGFNNPRRFHEAAIFDASFVTPGGDVWLFPAGCLV